MNQEHIYTMTIKMAQGGTEHIDDEGKSSNSKGGHMWYTLAEDGEQTDSYGFGPKEYGIPDLFGTYTKGTVLDKDDKNYQSTYATYEVQITKEQYMQLKEFGKDRNLEANNFNDFYKVASNSCVDYVWRAMEFAGVNPDKFQGDMFPKNNRDDVNAHLYQSINGTAIPKEEQALESTATDGSFTAMYGSTKADVLTSTKETEVVYGGKGNDTLIGIKDHADKLRGGVGDDTYKVQQGDSINDSDQKGKIYFDATLLSGVKHKVSEGVYEDAMFTYTEEKESLVIAQKADPSKSVTVENWDSQTKEALGIELSDEKVVEVEPTKELPKSINNYLEQYKQNKGKDLEPLLDELNLNEGKEKYTLLYEHYLDGKDQDSLAPLDELNEKDLEPLLDKLNLNEGKEKHTLEHYINGKDQDSLAPLDNSLLIEKYLEQYKPQEGQQQEVQEL